MRDGGASRTADRVAERRAAHQLLDAPLVFSDPFALRILGSDVADRLRAAPQEFDESPIAKFLRAFFAVRNRYAEDTLHEAVDSGVDQYVVVGAGFDTFALRNPYPDVHVIEVDHPATQAEKRSRLVTAGIKSPANLSFVSADLSIESLHTTLVRAGFARHKPAVFSWLGVIPYLEGHAVEATLRDICSFGKNNVVVFDYGIPRGSLSLAGQFIFDHMAARVAAVGEPWKTFFVPERLRSMLEEVGFTEIEDLGASDINARYFENRPDGLRVGEAAHLVKAKV